MGAVLHTPPGADGLSVSIAATSAWFLFPAQHDTDSELVGSITQDNQGESEDGERERERPRGGREPDCLRAVWAITLAGNIRPCRYVVRCEPRDLLQWRVATQLLWLSNAIATVPRGNRSGWSPYLVEQEEVNAGGQTKLNEAW
jgi:hypothetical protein